MKQLILIILLLMINTFIIQGQVCCRGGNTEGTHGGDEIEIVDTCNTLECLNCPPGTEVRTDETGTTRFCVRVIRGFDPNDIIGPEGVGEPKWVSKTQDLKYVIRFENDPKFASGAAQNVFVHFPFPKHIRRNSFTLGYYGFGYFAFNVPYNRSYVRANHDVSDSLGVAVDVQAGINSGKNEAFWRMVSLDPKTGLEPLDPILGFLPINDSVGHGEGFVQFTVQAKGNSKTGDSIKAQANIVFDDNESVITNTHVNIIDADNPESFLEIKKPVIDTAELHITATDIGSGLDRIEVFQSVNKGPLTFLDQVYSTDTVKFYPVSERDTVCFLSFATDKVGNFEGWQKVYKVCTKDVMDSDDEEEEETTINHWLETFPNPTAGELTVNVHKDTPKGTLYLFDTQGTILQTHNIGKGASTLNISLEDYPMGIYFLRFVNKEGQYVLRVVKL